MTVLADFEQRLDAILSDHEARLSALESVSQPAEQPLKIEGFAENVTGGLGFETFDVKTVGELIAALGSNRTIRLVRDGVWPADAIVKLLNLRNLTITGAGSRVMLLNRKNTGHVMRCVGCENIVLNDFVVAAGPGGEPDCVNLYQCENVALDHLSLRWGIDENLGITDCRNVTVQWSIIAEALDKSTHPKGPHSCGALVRELTDRINFHHTLFAHCDHRCPKVAKDSQLTDVRNCVIYNDAVGGRQAGLHMDATGNMNVVNNYYKAGPNKHPQQDWAMLATNGRIYLNGNKAVGVSRWLRTDDAVRVVAKPFAVPDVQTESADDAYASVLAFAGCRVRDATDVRIVQDVLNGGGRIKDTVPAD